MLEIGGSRGYSTVWLGAAARILGGHVTSLERDAAKQNYRFSALVMGIVNSPPFRMQMTRQLESDLRAQPGAKSDIK